MNHPEPLYITSNTGLQTRILTPEEYDQFTQSMKNMRLKTIFEIAFYTGLRYAELQRLHTHPEWIQPVRKNIHLPLEGQRKVKRRQLTRDIPIAPQIQNTLPYFFKNSPPASVIAWNEWLKRTAWKAGFEDDTGFGAKLTRKTIECWMIVSGLPLNKIYKRQGHTDIVSMEHYQNLAFTDGEVAEIQKRLAGW